MAVKLCGVPHPRVPEVTCTNYPHEGEWHKFVNEETGYTHEYRVRPPKKKVVNPPCLEED